MQKVYSKKVIRIKVRDRVEDAVMLLKEYPFVDKLISGEDTIQAGFEGDEADMSRVLSELVMVGIPVVSFAQLDGNLEDVFMKVTKGDEE
jgi:ABC-2 type transport system ATP-binding protein